MKKIFKFKRKSSIITLMDIIVISLMFMFLKGYFTVNKVVQSDKKDGIKYTTSLHRKKITENQFLIINLKIKNTKKVEKLIKIKRKVLFNLLIEKNNEILFKRDITDSMLKEEKLIKLSGGSNLNFNYLWDLYDYNENKVEPGIYKAVIYSLDLDVKHNFDFEITEEAAKE